MFPILKTNAKIYSELSRLFCRYGVAGSSNTTGDQQKKLDVLSNVLFINMIKHSFTTCLMVSEENENVIEVEVENKVSWPNCR